MRLTMVIAALLATTITAAADCRSADQVIDGQRKVGVVTWITGVQAASVAARIWSEVGKPAPLVDMLIITIMLNGSAVLTPVVGGMVCESGVSVQPSNVANILSGER